MFNIKLSVFPQSAEDHKRIRKEKYDATKKYPEFGGIANIPVSELPDLIKYLTHATPDYDDYLKQEVVPLRASGYMNESKAGNSLTGTFAIPPNSGYFFDGSYLSLRILL